MSSKKILIVDDDVIILNGLSRTLRASGYEVVTAADGSDAVSAARHQRPDLIILDITFPPDVAHGGGVAWDGFLIIDWLRRIDGAGKIPIVVITASDAAKYRDRALAMGAAGFFRKPINTEDLLQTLRSVLGEVPQEAPPPGP